MIRNRSNWLVIAFTHLTDRSFCRTISTKVRSVYQDQLLALSLGINIIHAHFRSSGQSFCRSQHHLHHSHRRYSRMGIILVISGFNRNITGKKSSRRRFRSSCSSGRMTGNLVTFDLYVQVADLAENVIDLLHIALFTAAFPCEPLKFILFSL